MTDDTQTLREYLAARDAPCPGCGYNLRGLPGDRCPECRQELVLAVRLAEPRLAAWIAGLVGLCFGVGFSGLLLAYFLIQITLGRGPGGWGLFFILTAVPLAVEGLPLLGWVAWRRRVQRVPASLRAGLAAFFWLLTLANFACFTLLIR